jgi:hypothetical protein
VPIPIKLKEEPREWRRFTLQVCAVMGLFGLLLTWRQVLAPAHLAGLAALLAVSALTAVFRPGWFRGFYRGGMTASAWLGEHTGRLFLLVFFAVAIVPLGWILRRVGYDPLALRKPEGPGGYWRRVERRGDLTRMY